MVHVARQEPEGAPAAAREPHDGFRQEILSAARRRSGRPPDKRKSIYKQVAEFTEDVSDLSGVNSPESERGPPSLSGSAPRQPSSGYESSPPLDSAKRLTQELSEYRQERRDYRDYGDYRPPAARPHDPLPGRGVPFGEVFGPARQGRRTPASIYSDVHSRAAHAARNHVATTDPYAETQPLRTAPMHNNYRREFALGSAASPLAAGADAEEAGRQASAAGEEAGQAAERGL
ncbi:uncharacterized protein LOC119111354 [Pollicipes pollicipes]|uniref:uncharacterized protein LOC119111354 n=1 Tax=Pollicipes pollicipes TaxID=41117 RepID=UPI00188526EC|nr:uncharacterized protein LOC119111354 [Pollicipes pollicipes]